MFIISKLSRTVNNEVYFTGCALLLNDTIPTDNEINCSKLNHDKPKETFQMKG